MIAIDSSVAGLNSVAGSWVLYIYNTMHQRNRLHVPDFGFNYFRHQEQITQREAFSGFNIFCLEEGYAAEDLAAKEQDVENWVRLFGYLRGAITCGCEINPRFDSRVYRWEPDYAPWAELPLEIRRHIVAVGELGQKDLKNALFSGWYWASAIITQNNPRPTVDLRVGHEAIKHLVLSLRQIISGFDVERVMWKETINALRIKNVKESNRKRHYKLRRQQILDLLVTCHTTEEVRTWTMGESRNYESRLGRAKLDLSALLERAAVGDAQFQELRESYDIMHECYQRGLADTAVLKRDLQRAERHTEEWKKLYFKKSNLAPAVDYL